ncbi:MAG: YncE family protein [Bryobacteraceae bacterium]
MKRVVTFVNAHIVAALSISFALAASNAPLVLIHTTPLPGVKGDFDHFAADIKGNRLFLTAEDHHSVEVFDLSSGKSLQSVGGFDTPHSILYMPEKKELFVIDGGDGTCKILSGENYKIVKTLKVGPEADSMVYEPIHKAPLCRGRGR